MIESSSYFSEVYNRYPKFQDLPDDMTAFEYLEFLCKEKLWERLGGLPPQNYRDRIDRELKIIKKTGFVDYLLIVHQFIEGAKSQDVLVGPGRGSAAGCLVAYALGITQIDPIKYGLVFERFLNYGRSATPLIFNQSMIEEIESQGEQNGPEAHHLHI